MSPPPSDRDAILARRALLISTALAGLSCTSSGVKGSGVEQAETKVAAEGKLEPEQPELEPEQPKQPKPDEPWAELIAKAPPLDIPEGLSERELAQLRTQVTVLEGEYELLRGLWEDTRGCAVTAEDPAQDSCKVWGELANKLKPYVRDDRFGINAGCASDAGQTGSSSARWQAHMRFKKAIVARIEAHLGELAASFGDATTKRWEQEIGMARAPMPQPCLSACRMPAFPDLLTLVPFASGSAELKLEQPPTQLLEIVQSYAATKLAVRGHADPSEPEPEALAKQRAEAVVAWLVESGFPADKLEVVSLGARLPIEQGEAGLEHNPRVDFEVMPPGSLRQP